LDSDQLLFCTLSMTLEYTQVVSNPDEIRSSPFMVVSSSGHLTEHSVLLDSTGLDWDIRPHCDPQWIYFNSAQMF